ncbi:MAG: tRNA (adenosine(37)-N6)-threonylcarbamoyltransferase complex dimerization subunit type 1 TsaB [Legionella sp.]|nr:tRNA (adenosine(37)-N6)-threonylcarbamoyltransferase complex dimerization subunit type 1 TsaB [Legionella sp.]
MMNLLAIDTSTDIASLALQVGDDCLYKEQASQKTHANLILPLIDGLLSEAAISLKQLDGIIFGSGPGSFTGLRIACSIAKGLAFGQEDLGLIPVNTLSALTYGLRQQNKYSDHAVLAVLDARMSQLYWSYFPKNEFLVTEQKVSAPQDIILPAGTSVVLAGLGGELYWDAFSEDLKTQIQHKVKVYPSAVSMIGLALTCQLKPIAPDQAHPIYVRNQVTHT